MSPQSALDLEALLAPIAGDNPAGENLKYSGLHDEIREARRSDEDAEATEGKTASWEDVISLATTALETKTKDLQVAAWLGEAAARTSGFEGAASALALVRELLARFWDHLYPEIEDGDVEARANVLAQFGRQLGIAIKEARITNAPAFTYLQLEDAQRQQKEKIQDKDSSSAEAQKMQEIVDKAAKTEDAFKKAQGASRRAFYEALAPPLEAAWQELSSLLRLVGERFGNQAPALRDLKTALEAVRTWVDKTLKEKRILEPDPPEGGSTSVIPDAGGSGGASTSGGSGVVTGRRDALSKLQEVADYFRRTEPHSPVTYLVERAIRWGEMPLADWLQDVIKDSGTLGQLRETLGLKPPGKRVERDRGRTGRREAYPWNATGAEGQARGERHLSPSGKELDGRCRPRRGCVRRARGQKGSAMPKKESIQQKLKRVRPPRVQITYDVEIGGAIEMKELPFVVGVVGDFTGMPDQPLPALKNRKITEIDRDNFDKVLSAMTPHLTYRVDNKLADDGSKMSVDMRFNKLDDFEPDNVVQQIEPLRKLVEARQQLRDLLSKTDGNEKLEELLGDVLKNTAAQQQLGQALGLPPGEGAPKKEGEGS